MTAAREENVPQVAPLRRDLKLLHNAEGAVWFDPVADRYFQLDEALLTLSGFLKDALPLDELLARGAAAGLDRETVLQGVLFLKHHHLLRLPPEEAMAAAGKVAALERGMLWQKVLSSYLFLQFTLCRPDRFLTRTLPWVRMIFNRPVVWLLLLSAAAGYLGLIRHWTAVGDMFAHSLSRRGLINYALAVTAVKIIHELAHAYVAKSYGVRVRRFGLGFIVFLPRLFTDVTDGWQLSDRRGRIWIDAAGIAAEVAIGGLAALMWAASSPGALHTVCFYLFAVSALNTVFVNGNPLIRYDGYFLLMDALGIHNLQQRSLQEVRRRFQHHVLGMPAGPAPERSGWLLVYGIASFIYRLFLYTAIIMVVYFRFTKTIGLALLLLEFYLLVWRPLRREFQWYWRQRERLRPARAVLFGGGLLVLLGILALPLPWTLRLPMEVSAGAVEYFYVRQPGYLQNWASDGQWVEPQQPLIETMNPEFDNAAQRAQLAFRRAEEEFRQAGRTPERQRELPALEQQRQRALENVHEMVRRQRQLRCESAFAGRFARIADSAHVGEFLAPGRLMGVLYDEKPLIRAYAGEKEIGWLRERQEVQLRLAGEWNSCRGIIRSVGAIPVAVVNSPLLDLYGGPLATVRGRDGRPELQERFYLVEIVPSAGEWSGQFGRSGEVSCRRYRSLGMLLFRQLFQLLRRELSF
ncbi:M50 family metallopeptidase [Victivallis sp. Marseille-Q1083]|uniref:M50 family metallopeptidase n=1 Tax=Victivallis sp. Marseille-Q1083 TaxID=2717288 RepID=UPI00158AAD36|nr:M50 family metallopeptidase [Victivallis sp. Marseille-Q1083]